MQDPLKSASLNRYSYAWNNPLNATDPSGYFLFSLIIAAALHEAALGTFIEFALFAFGGMADALASGAHLGDALLAGLSAGAFSFAGGKFADTGVGFGKNWETAADVASVGTIGGVTSILQGGRFGDGFKSAGVGTVLGGVAGRVSANYGELGRGIAMTVAAGTASAITGGKFANGAITTAFWKAAAGVASKSAMADRQVAPVTDAVSYLSPEQKMQADLAVAAAIGDLAGANIAGSPEGVAKILGERIFPIAESYDIEFAAWITRIGDGWGFTDLRTDYLPFDVFRIGGGSGLRWHVHQRGGSFSPDDINNLIGIENKNNPNFRPDLRDAYISRSTNNVDKFDYESYVNAIRGLGNEASAYRDKTIGNRGNPHVIHFNY